MDRCALVFLLDAYAEDEAPNAKGKLEKRTVLRLDPRLSPVKVAVLPLSRNAELSPIARDLGAQLRRTWNVEFDDAGAIGRRYRRQDEIGTPFCVTVDFDSLQDSAVTVRERDSMKQDRVGMDGLAGVPDRAARRLLTPGPWLALSWTGCARGRFDSSRRPRVTKYVYDFSEGDKDQKDLLGGKGANLAEMTNLGIPVPAGFTITTEACKEYLHSGSEPAELQSQVARRPCQDRETMGKKLGDPDDPLLISVRSGAKFSMPGMMETVLNIGLNDRSVEGIARAERQRALRLGLLPAPAADVRQDRPRHRGQAVRRGAREGQERAGHHCRPRPRPPTTSRI